MKTIKFVFTVNATPHKVYEAFMDQKKHARFTNDQAKISRRVGGSFSVFNGYATGINVKLVPDKEIVQTWRASDWPDKHFSTITFAFAPAKQGTKVTFTQKDVPNEFAKTTEEGWIDYYWDPLKEMFP